ncbi:MAG: extracellular solute-binding protein [Oscillospiraceae bacterium]|nr:extracellular solute-binding protein [Oscillospiraceae bacterium]
MKKEKISAIINQISDRHIEEAAVFAQEKDQRTQEDLVSDKTHKKKTRQFKWSIAAACLAFLVVISSSMFALAFEINEYNTAVAFFEYNRLSADGLNRKDVKAVYRDITTNSFSYDKTVDVLRQAVPNWEKQQSEPTSEELAALWNRNFCTNPFPPEDKSSESNDSDFVMPVATGALTVYGCEALEAILSPAVDIFREEYPDVDVNYVQLSEEEFDVRISTELSAGKGPDLLFCFSRDIPDPYKAMTVRLFEDLNPYFENDDGFGFENYLGEVMNCGILNGERQLVPIEIQIPLYKTSLEAISETVMPDAERKYKEYLTEAGQEDTSGIIQTFEDFCSACIQYHEENPDDMLFSTGEKGDYISELLYASGMQFIDYETGQVTVREEELHTVLDVCRAFHSENGQTVSVNEKQTNSTIKNAFLSSTGSNPVVVLSELQNTRSKGETPYLFPIYDVDGGMTAEVLSYAAILRSAQNKLNAYRLLCILLSEEIQSGHEQSEAKTEFLHVGIPVLKSAIISSTMSAYDTYFSGVAESAGDAQLFIDYCTSVTHASMIPNVIMRYLYLEMTPYIRGEKNWEECYGRLLNTLTLYANG